MENNIEFIRKSKAIYNLLNFIMKNTTWDKNKNVFSLWCCGNTHNTRCVGISYAMNYKEFSYIHEGIDFPNEKLGFGRSSIYDIVSKILDYVSVISIDCRFGFMFFVSDFELKFSHDEIKLIELAAWKLGAVVE